MDTLAPNERRDLEEAGARRPPRDRHANGVNERRRFHAADLGRGAKRRFRGRRIECRQPGERRVERGEMRAHAIDPKVRGDSRRVILNSILEEKIAEYGEVAEPLRARLQQLEHRKKPRVPLAKIGVMPQTRRFK